MLPRERVINALEFKPSDKPALDCDVSYVGVYEHGEKLVSLLKTIEGDFGAVSNLPVPVIPPQFKDTDGSYLEYVEDTWGVTWEYRTFGIQGHPIKRPLDDWAALDSYKMPDMPPDWFMYPTGKANLYRYTKSPVPQGASRAEGEAIIKKLVAEERKTYFKRAGWISIIETMEILRDYESVMMDLFDNTPEINCLADMLMLRWKDAIDRLIRYDYDAVQFGDDYGTQTAMIISPEIFRKFFKPRYKELIAPIKAAGKKVLFHLCGYSLPILEDLKEVGVDAIWPQLNVYGDLKEFADYCRSIELAVSIHPERSELMTFGKPDEIKRRIHGYNEIFRPAEGGSYFYLEMDNGFPYENIVAMAEAIGEIRK